MQKGFNDNCGVFGIFGNEEASRLTYLGLYALQHRGQESAGIVSSDGKTLHSHRSMGLVYDVFDSTRLKALPGMSAIGHVRYSTTGASTLRNAQPFVVDYAKGGLAIAHNGNIVNALLLREELENDGSIFQSTMDTEVIVHLIATSKMPTLVERLISALKQVKGAYSLLILTECFLIAARDPNGFRPLVMGKLNDSIVFASETCAFDLIGATCIREVEPGEIIVVSEKGMESIKPFEKRKLSQCIFEYIYFARPDSYVFGKCVYKIRTEFGRVLAREQPVDADIVVPVPDSGVPAAIGFAQESGIPFEMGLIRNHYVGRTFIEPVQSIRHFGVKVKLNPVREIIEGKKVVLIDDSIVRGTTSRKIVKMVKQAGAKEVHVRISSPPTTHSCYYGIDTPTREELIASSHSVEEIAKFITAKSLGYLSHKGMMSVLGEESQNFCHACFSGNYPVEIPLILQAPQLNLFEKKNGKRKRKTA